MSHDAPKHAFQQVMVQVPISIVLNPGEIYNSRVLKVTVLIISKSKFSFVYK